MEWIQPTSSTMLSLLIGLGLSASCGFRIFVPPFIISLAALGGHLELSENFAWMATLPAVLALGTAVALEVAAYYLPLVDNLLDTIAAPAAAASVASVGGSVRTSIAGQTLVYAPADATTPWRHKGVAPSAPLAVLWN